ncbi:MAG TPA: DUF4342 domain-containing protein [Anaerolineales bacterium]
MSQTQLAFSRRSFHLSRVAIADPDFGGVVGLVLAPTLAAVGAIAALVTEATIVVKKVA